MNIVVEDVRGKVVFILQSRLNSEDQEKLGDKLKDEHGAAAVIFIE